MKKKLLILGIVLAMVAALVIPTAVFAAPTTTQAPTTTTVVVTGLDAAPTVSFTAPGAINLDNSSGMMTAGWNTGTGTPGAVTLTQGTSGTATYTITAVGASNMVNGSSTPLQNYLLIGNTSTSGGWFIANGGSGSVDGYSFSGTLTYTGPASGSLPFFADQYVTPTDALGVYTDTITFTATCMP